MKMGKKVKEYKAGDFIFAKVKGYPAWPARVQRLNGKKYFVYFYGTGETANLPPNMIFDYVENKDKFLNKTVKRRDFNDGVKQIEHDFANNVPIEEVVGTIAEVPADASVNDTLNDSANETLNDSAVGDTSADETLNDATPANTTQNSAPIEDSDDTGSLVIDEGKKGKKPLPKTPAKETPKAKELKTPRGRAKKEEAKEDKESERKEAEIISRSGRKIRPKRYIDEQTEDNATLPSPATKKRRGQTPEKETAVEEKKKEKSDKNNKLYNTIPQSELEDLKKPTIAAVGSEKENILITYLPTGTYVGVKLFQSVPSVFKTENVKLQWYKQQASNALNIKLQLERGQILPQSIASQLVTDLNLTEEEKATLDKERETEEKKSRVQFLKTEMKLIELDAKIKTCLCLEKADTESCLKLLDELMELNLKPLMLLKHPTCVETVKRMRAYVGNTPCWRLSEPDALQFSKHAQCIRKQADTLYNNMKNLFSVTDGLSFWEYFSERVLQFKKATAKLNADVLLEMVHEPIEMSQPAAHTMKSAIDEANNEEKTDDKTSDEPASKKKSAPAKKKKDATATNSTPAKSLKRQSSRNKQSEKEPEPADDAEPQNGDDNVDNTDKDTPTKEKSPDKPEEKSTEEPETETTKDSEKDAANENKETTEEQDKSTENNDDSEQNDKSVTENDKEETEAMEVDTEKDKEEEKSDKQTDGKDKEQNSNDSEEQNDKESEKQSKVAEKQNKEADKPNKEKGKEKEKEKEKDIEKEQDKDKEIEKEKGKDKEETEKEDDKQDNEKSNDKDKDTDEPRAKRSRENKKTDAPPSRSPTKRKSKV